jgi:TolA-binding protein
MVVKDRRSGKRNWIPGLFASFWVLLAVFSGAYLFRIVTDPTAHRVETASASPSATSATPNPEPSAPAPVSAQPAAPPSLSPEQATVLLRANEAKDRELTELKSQLRDLSGQVSELNTRLKPLEKVLGPVAALPSSASVTTSMPSPEPMRPEEKPPEPPKPEAAPAKPAEKPSEQAKAPEKPSVPAKPAEKPSVQAKAPPEKPAAQDDADEASSHAASDSERSISTEQPSPHSAATPSSPDQKPSEKASAPVHVTSNEPASTPATDSTDTANLSAPPPIPPGTTRFGIEIGNVEKQDKVRPMWRDLLANHAALVAGLQARRIIAPDKKWRLIAGPFSSAAEAMQACGLFKKANMPCEATVFAGDAL